MTSNAVMAPLSIRRSSLFVARIGFRRKIPHTKLASNMTKRISHKTHIYTHIIHKYYYRPPYYNTAFCTLSPPNTTFHHAILYHGHGEIMSSK